MNNGTTIWDLKSLIKCCNENHAEINGQWMPARPYGWSGLIHRARAAWLVFTGKADVIVWPGNQ